MDPTNISHWTNESELPGQSVSYNGTETRDTQNVAVLILCSLGLPGNLFVLAVYVARMTSSMRVYMFSLAIADTVVCINGIVLSVAYIDTVSRFIILIIIDTCLICTVLLLTFVSIERLIAIRRPHNFSLHPSRAKKSLVIIALAAAILEALGRISEFTGNSRLGGIIFALVLLFCVTVMVTCYSLMAVSLLQKARASKVKVGVVINFSCPATAASTGVVPMTHLSETTSVPTTIVKKTTAAQAKIVRGVLVLFIITVVFLVFWLPAWLSHAGVSVSPDVKRLFVVNSVVNPLIYGVTSPMFRDDVRQFFRQVRVWQSVCCH